MSSWLADLDRSLIMPRGKSQRKREEVQCKLGKHRVPQGVPLAWLRDPMGLSCVPCIQEAGLEVPPDPKPPAAAPVPKPRTPKRTRTTSGSTSRPTVVPAPAAVVVPMTWVRPDPDAWRTDPDHWRHGKKWTYDHHRCRCQPCITAGTPAGLKRRARQRARRAGGQVLELAA